MRLLLAASLFAASSSPAAGQTSPTAVHVTGTVVDSATGSPLGGARVRARVSTMLEGTSATTDSLGRFQLTFFASEAYEIAVNRLGYQMIRRELKSAASGENLVIAMHARPVELNSVVVSASKREEKVLDAPAAVFVVSDEAVAVRVAPTLIDHLRAIPGLDVASGGILQNSVSSRGFNSAFSGQLLLMSDYRFTTLPALRVNIPYLMPNMDQDVDRIEVVDGPGAALYGPNATSGVIHVITRSPFDVPGGSVAVDGGTNSYARTAVRYAATLNPKLAFRLSADVMRARDFESTDTLEARLIATRRDAPRNFDLSRYGTELRVDLRPTTRDELVFTAGRAEVGSALEPTATGAGQAKGWAFTTAQLRARHSNLFAQVFLNASDAGESVQLRSGSRIVDRSRQLAGQVQWSQDLGTRQTFIYGVDAIATTPISEGTISGRNEPYDNIMETGAYLHSVTRVTKAVDFVAAARVDEHSEIAGAVFSPRLALVFKPAMGRTMRLTYNRAFSPPTSSQFFIDQSIQPLAPGLPYNLQAVGVPSSGFHVRRDCAGGVSNLCMRSPLTLPSAGGATAFLPANAAAFWPSAVNAFAGLLPASAQAIVPLLKALSPTSAQVGTQLMLLNPGVGAFQPIASSSVPDYPALKPTISDVFEAGYKTMVGARFSLDAALWHQTRKDFVFGGVSTPNVFFDAPSLQKYLTDALTAFGVPDAATVAAGLAGGMATLPLGTVQADQSLVRPADINFTFRNAALVRNWGVDMRGDLLAGGGFSLVGTYSWIDHNLFDAGGLEEVSLNAPQHKGTLSVRYQDDGRGTFAELRGRHVSGFPVRDGVLREDLPTYDLLDATASILPNVLRGARWSITATNILGREHKEYAGGAMIGRLVITRLQLGF